MSSNLLNMKTKFSCTQWSLVRLGDILAYEQPAEYLVHSSTYKDEYAIPVLTAGKTFLLGYTNEQQGTFPAEKLPVIIFDDFTTAIKFVDFPFKIKSSAVKILKMQKDFKVNMRFVFCVMQGIAYESSGHKRYWISEYSKIKISLPAFKEQCQIVRIIEAWDKYIEKMDRKIELKRNIKKGLMQQIFSQKIRFKDRGGLDYPKWKDVSLNQVLEGGSKIAVKDNSKYKKITIKLHKKGIMFFAEARKMADTRPFYVRKEGEIIIGKQNYFNGSIAVVDDKHAGAICSNAIMSFCVNKGYSSNYIYEYISTDSFIRKREYLANGTGQKELSEKDFLNFKIKAPTYEEQKQIADFALYMDKATEVLGTKRELADNVRKYLLNNLVSGKIRVPKNLESKVKKENA